MIRPYEHKFDLPGVMSFHLLPHLPRLVTWERRKIASDKQADRHTLRKCMHRYICNVCVRAHMHVREYVFFFFAILFYFSSSE